MYQKENNNLEKLLTTVRSLLGEDGCPWDKKQNNQSIIKYLQSEVNEVIEALEKEDHPNLCEELGDVLFIIMLITSYNHDRDRFSFDDVLEGVNQKLVRRHPHVFAGTSYETEEDLAQQWERIKADEKKSILPKE